MNRGDEGKAELPDFDPLKAEMHEGFDSMNRLIIRGGAVLFGTMVVGFIGLVVTTIFTQH